jgi:hypothetical protein
MASGSLQPPPPQLNYGAQPPSRRRWLLALVAVAAATAVCLGVLFARSAIARWQARRAYDRQAEAWYAAATARAGTPGKLRYSEVAADVAAGGGLVRRFADGRSDIYYPDPATDLRQAYADPGGGAPGRVPAMPILTRDWPIVFTHERTNSVGLTRLIMVVVDVA